MGIPLAPQNGTYRVRILVVDDDEADRLAVRRCLHQSGLSVAIEEARTGAETLELIAHSDYDCVFLDYYLPDVAGLSLLESLQAAAPELPVVIFTGRGGEDIAVELMKAGAADYLPKASMTPERLAAGLRHAMELARATAARRQAENELRAEESRFRTLANAIPQFAWMADASGARYWFNQRWLDYTGIPLEELTGWDWRAAGSSSRSRRPRHPTDPRELCDGRTVGRHLSTAWQGRDLSLVLVACPRHSRDRWRYCRLARHEHGCYGSEKRGGRTGTAHVA